MPRSRSTLGIPHSGSSSSKCKSEALGSEENVALISETPNPTPQHRAIISPSVLRVGLNQILVPDHKVTFSTPRPRAKSLLGQQKCNLINSNRLSLQICPPTPPTPSCSVEEVNGHWSDREVEERGGVTRSSSSHLDDPHPPSCHTEIIYDEQAYDPLRVVRSPHPINDYHRRKSFAKEALSLLIGLNPPPRTLSATDFTDFDSKFPLGKPGEIKEVKAYHKDLTCVNGPRKLSSSHSENKIWGTGSAKNSAVYDNFDEIGNSLVDGSTGQVGILLTSLLLSVPLRLFTFLKA
jgi:hypothetical protein